MTREDHMLRTILIYGTIAGLIVGLPMLTMMLVWKSPDPMGGGLYIGYGIMLIALSAVFVGVKSYRDKVRGGVIKFFPALGVGLAISLVAGVFYVLAWELSLALTHVDYIAGYANAEIRSLKATGASQAEIDKLSASMDAMKAMYANPILRMGMTLTEILPVGVLVSLVSAGLLRNSRFMPARATA
jgi:hypothetical protein